MSLLSCVFQAALAYSNLGCTRPVYVVSFTLRGGGGGTPLYGLYRYVRPQRVWVFSRFGHKLGIDFSHFAAILATYARYAEKLFTQIYRNSLKK